MHLRVKVFDEMPQRQSTVLSSFPVERLNDDGGNHLSLAAVAWVFFSLGNSPGIFLLLRTYITTIMGGFQCSVEIFEKLKNENFLLQKDNKAWAKGSVATV